MYGGSEHLEKQPRMEDERCCCKFLRPCIEILSQLDESADWCANQQCNSCSKHTQCDHWIQIEFHRHSGAERQSSPSWGWRPLSCLYRGQWNGLLWSCHKVYRQQHQQPELTVGGQWCGVPDSELCRFRTQQFRVKLSTTNSSPSFTRNEALGAADHGSKSPSCSDSGINDSRGSSDSGIVASRPFEPATVLGSQSLISLGLELRYRQAKVAADLTGRDALTTSASGTR